MRILLEEILGLIEGYILIMAFIDNMRVLLAIHSSKMVDDKHLRINLGAIKEALEFHKVEAIRWCIGDKQIANCLTKRGASPYLLLNILQTGVLDIPSIDI